MATSKSVLSVFAVCIRNTGFAASLEMRKIYRVLPDADSKRSGMVRVIDESGEDYLYPAAWFVPIKLTAELQTKIQLAS